MPAASISTPRKLLFAALIAFLPPLFLVALLEISLRAVGYGYSPRFWEEAMIDSTAVDAPNPDFTRLFFPEALKRLFVPFAVPKEKASDEFRVLVLGGSAINGDPDPGYSVPRMVERQLNHVQGERRVVVINAALTACNSHVAREIAKDFGRLRPDMIVVYMGNNEVVGPFGPANRISAGRLGSTLPRAQVAVRKTRTGQWIQSLVEPAEASAQEWRGMQHFLAYRFPWESPDLESVYENFAHNLAFIARRAARSGVPVLFSTVAVNLHDQPPFFGEAAAAAFSEAERLAAAGDTHAAADTFQRARDLDELRFRADSRTNEIIRTTAESHPNARLLDAEAAFQERAAQPAPGFEFFYEHVHFNFHGAYVLSRLMAEAVLHNAEDLVKPRAGWLGFEEMQAHLAFTDYDVWTILREIINRFDNPPFTGIENYATRVQWMRDLYAHFSESIALAETKTRVNRQYVDAIRARPGDAELRARLARFFVANDRPAEALPLLRKLVRKQPNDLSTLDTLLRAAMMTTSWEDVAEHHADLARITPHHPGVPLYRAGAAFHRGETRTAKRLLAEYTDARGSGSATRPLEEALAGHSQP
ncbi:MAG: hypothetical protein JJU00_04465 [Opitutales bacterium]|nr:hypothetical protein [Opitutales bacterium]